MPYFLKVAFFSFLSGVFSGMFGIGGGLILTPVVRIVFQKSPEIALGTTLPVIIPTALFGLISRIGKRHFRPDVFIYASAGIFFGSIAGSYSTKFIPAWSLLGFTAIIIFLAGIKLVYPNAFSFFFKNKISAFKHLNSSLKHLLVGALAGVFSGLLGLGGGLILVPGFLLVSGLNSHEATATSLGLVLLAALPGTVIHSALGHIDWKLAVNLSLFAPVGSIAGGLIAERITSRQLEFLFGLFLVILGVYFLIFEVLY